MLFEWLNNINWNCEHEKMDKVLLKNMLFYAHHGVIEAERQIGQKFVIDVEMRRDLRAAGRNDDLNLTVDYEKVYEFISNIVNKKKYFLIEAIAEEIADKILVNFDVAAVIVRVSKPQVAIRGILDGVTVEIKRERGAGNE